MSDNKEGEQQPTNEWGPETPPLFAQPNKPPETEIESGEPVIVMPEETPISAPEKPTVATSARPVPRPEPIIAEESATQTPEVPLTVPVTAIPLEVATTTPSTEEPMTPVLEDEIIPESESPTEEIHIPISIPTETEAPSGTADSAPIESSEPEITPEVTPEAIPIPEREPTIVRPDGELLRSVQEAVDSLPESSAKEEVKERIEELQTSDFTHNDKGEDLGDTFEQKQARINLKVTKLTDNLEELKLPLPTLEEEEEPMAENNIVLQSQLLLNISENNKYNQINRENLERTIRLAATLIGHDQEAIKEAALRQTLEITPGVRTRLIEIVPETLDQIKEYIAKAQEDVVFMSVPGAQESLDSYKRTVDRLEEILLGSIQNYRISEVVTRLRGSLEDSDRRRPEETAEREAGTEEAIEAIPAGGEGGGGEILPPGGERATGSEVLASEALRTNMGLARDEYLDAYLIRKKWFRKRVSPELEKRLREDYMKATLQYAKQIAKEEVEKVNPEVAGAEKQALIEAKMIIESQNERKALSDLEIKRNDENKLLATTAERKSWRP